jgi:uracil DNA glycosylase
MHESWQKALQPEFNKPYFTKVMDVSEINFALLTLSQLKTFLLAEHTSHTVYPTSEYSIYNIYISLTGLQKLITYTLGQDLRLSMKLKLLFSAKSVLVFH